MITPYPNSIIVAFTLLLTIDSYCLTYTTVPIPTKSMIKSRHPLSRIVKEWQDTRIDRTLYPFGLDSRHQQPSKKKLLSSLSLRSSVLTDEDVATTTTTTTMMKATTLNDDTTKHSVESSESSGSITTITSSSKNNDKDEDNDLMRLYQQIGMQRDQLALGVKPEEFLKYIGT
jgi:hypothetical protein